MYNLVCICKLIGKKTTNFFIFKNKVITLSFELSELINYKLKLLWQNLLKSHLF